MANSYQIYTIDTTTYLTENLVDPGLAEYQGPALLVYNNSVFSEQDFTSLKRLGDSQKVKDKLATGKFGLGFSSVLSRQEYQLILTGLRMDRFAYHIIGEVLRCSQPAYVPRD